MNSDIGEVKFNLMENMLLNDARHDANTSNYDSQKNNMHKTHQDRNVLEQCIQNFNKNSIELHNLFNRQEGAKKITELRIASVKSNSHDTNLLLQAIQSATSLEVLRLSNLSINDQVQV